MKSSLRPATPQALVAWAHAGRIGLGSRVCVRKLDGTPYLASVEGIVTTGGVITRVLTRRSTDYTLADYHSDFAEVMA